MVQVAEPGGHAELNQALAPSAGAGAVTADKAARTFGDGTPGASTTGAVRVRLSRVDVASIVAAHARAAPVRRVRRRGDRLTRWMVRLFG